jgi:hypothetical protein
LISDISRRVDVIARQNYLLRDENTAKAHAKMMRDIFNQTNLLLDEASDFCAVAKVIKAKMEALEAAMNTAVANQE